MTKEPHELESGRGTFKYRNKLVTRLIGGWELFGQKVTTIKEVDSLIDIAYQSIEDSIERGKISETTLQK